MRYLQELLQGIYRYCFRMYSDIDAKLIPSNVLEISPEIPSREPTRVTNGRILLFPEIATMMSL